MAGMGGGSSGQMSPDTARRLAALIAADAQQLADKAQEQGVTAFLGRAVKRERPNERFLQNTLRNLASANKRQEERAMWAAWEAEQGQQQQQQPEHKRPRWSAGKAGQQVAGVGSSRDTSRRAGRHSSSPSRSRSRSRDRNFRAHIRSRSPRNQQRSRSRSRSHGRYRSPSRCSSQDRSPSSSQDRGLDSQHRRPARNALGNTNVTAAAAVDDDGDAAGAAGHTLQAHAAAAHDTVDWSEEDAGGDQQLLQWLAGSKAVKGRGGIGPHADVPGPYLPAPENADTLQEGTGKGPAKPPWLQGAADGGTRLKPSAAFLRGVLTSQGLAGGGQRGKGLKDTGGAAAVSETTSSSSSSSGGGGSDASSGSNSSHRRKRRRRDKHKSDADSRKKHKKHKKLKKQKKSRQKPKRSKHH